jgi:hypothetical protein
MSARRLGFGGCLAVILVALASLLGAASASAQTFTVTNLANTGAGSLREAVKEADALAGADTVGFAAGLSGTITLSGDGLQITDSLDIEGPGPNQIEVAQSSAERVIHINLAAPGAVTISGLHIDGGTAPASGNHANYGGDILNDQTNAVAALTIVDSLITGGKAPSDGGGIESFESPLTLISSTVAGNTAAVSGGVEMGGSAGYKIEDSTISGNFAEDQTGGLEGPLEGADGLIEGSTISGNITAGDEGGLDVYAYKSGHFTMRNSTVAGNVAEGNVGLGNGGGLVLGTDTTGTVSLESSTIAANRAEGDAPFGDGGGILANPSNISLQNTIVAGNRSLNGPDIYGSAGAAFSLIGNAAGTELIETGPGSNLIGVDPQLGPLAANGGPTATMALPPTSPAVNRGGSALTTDQRGDPRPVIYPGVSLSSAPGANGSDIGAYELSSPPATGGPPPPPVAPVLPTPAVKGPPRVRISCPKGARPDGCLFTLQVVSKKPRKAKGKGRGANPPLLESVVAKARLRAGKSALLTLAPKPRFAAKLDAAKKLLVRETKTVDGVTRTTYRRLKVVG